MCFILTMKEVACIPLKGHLLDQAVLYHDRLRAIMEHLFNTEGRKILNIIV